MSSTLKRIIDDHPGASLVINHHARKATSDDFVDAVSGTHGLAGAADTVLVLTRNRTETPGLLQVSGRDVAEGEYALNFTGGAVWQLEGRDLDQAAAAAIQRRATVNHSDRFAAIYQFVRTHHPEPVRAKEVAERFGEDAPR